MPTGVAEPAERLFSNELQDELMKHAGKWVVIHDDRVVAVGATPKAAYEAATEALDASPEIILHHVPDDSNVAYFF